MLLNIILEDAKKNYDEMYDKIGDVIHRSLAGNRDYIDSNIVLNMDNKPVENSTAGEECAECTLYLSADDCMDIEYIRKKAKEAINIFCDNFVKGDSKDEDEIVEFIMRRFAEDCKWLDGNCYYVAIILKDRFPGGDIYYDVAKGHFLFKYKENFYDWTGVVAKCESEENLIKWDEFEKYDKQQKERIVRDCLL